jgi:tetratricopeptide (TPR) repeat protein
VVDTDLSKRVAVLNANHAYKEAIALANRIQRDVRPLAGVAYESGYAHNQLGRVDAALTAYGTAIDLDPKMAAARYDRGEIYISLGRWTDARADFIMVVAEQPNHWAGHFRLAHVAGALGDASGLERHLTEAIRHGFDLTVMAQDPQWLGFAQTPALGVVLRKIIVLYGTDELLRDFGGAQ